MEKQKILDVNSYLKNDCGYIAALTAFIVVNKSGLPGNLPEYIYWLIPTFILTPLIIYWSKPYKQ